jgi:hypothetical protein
MKKLLVAVAILACLYGAGVRARLFHAPGATETDATNSEIAEAYRSHQSNILVQGEGHVSRILSDDNDGSRHQRFIVELPGGQTLLIAHNIDLAPRIASIAVDDLVEFSGEYEWNDKGGVIHWTHRDPNEKHKAGWIKHNGRTYQ